MKPKHTFRGVVIHENQPRFKGITPVPPPTAKSGPAKIRVGREISGRGGKGVSVISGLPLAGEALEDLATRLEKTCGAGGAVKDGTCECKAYHGARRDAA